MINYVFFDSQMSQKYHIKEKIQFAKFLHNVGVTLINDCQCAGGNISFDHILSQLICFIKSYNISCAFLWCLTSPHIPQHVNMSPVTTS